MSAQETYLRAILATVARQTFAPAAIAKIVLKNGGARQFKAFNLCDGTLTQGEIAKEAGIDPANFSKAISRWAEAGIVIRVMDGQKIKPVHVYPLEQSLLKSA